MEQIDSRHIHLWLAFLAELTDPSLLAEYRQLLTEQELRQQLRFRFERDKHRYLVTRAMVRTVLSKYADVAPRDWQFEVNAYGRPSIAAEHEVAAGIEFNLSHTDGLVVLGVARGRALGVDVENVCTRQSGIEIADRYFAPAEVAAMRALPPEQQARRFFEYWTLKESYIKARGMGLSIPLDHFSFDLSRARDARIVMDKRLGDSPSKWCFWQLQPRAEHLVAVCAQRLEAEPPRWTMRRFVPLHGERRLLSPFSRRSQ